MSNRRFWVRFFAGVEGDSRPLTFPSPVEWWCTGYREGDRPNVICAIVDALDEEAAKAAVTAPGLWPEAEIDSMLLRATDWRPSPDRFPPKVPA